MLHVLHTLEAAVFMENLCHNFYVVCKLNPKTKRKKVNYAAKKQVHLAKEAGEQHNEQKTASEHIRQKTPTLPKTIKT